MPDSGHFTLEAAVALAIVGSLLATGQMLARNAALRTERSRKVFKEALALETALNCTPRIMTREYVEQIRTTCRLDEAKEGEGVLRTYSIAPKREGNPDSFPHLLTIELER